MGKHAYLIIAHNNFYILKKLVELLDYKDNDIYIHVDKKVKDFPFNEIRDKVKISNLYYTKRMNVYWGGFSQIQCELLLLKESFRNKYKYYHLLSGVDLPLKSQKYIHNFFEKNNGKEFIHFSGKEKVNNVYKRISIYHSWQLYQKSKNTIFRYPARVLKKILEILQIELKLNRLNKYNKEIKYGANWFSITHNCVEYILEKEKEIYKNYKHSYCADEVFLQTLIYNSELKNNLYYNKYDDNYISIVRNIDWSRGKPYVFRIDDYQDLIDSEHMFARKFDVNVDKEIIDKIYKYVKESENN